MIFIDTNYFIRFLLDDIPDQHLKAKKLFESGLKGEEDLFTSTIVFFELYWVFTSFYKKPKQEVRGILRDVLRLSFIHFENIGVLRKALRLFENSSLELADCYNIEFAKSKKSKDFATFDKKARKLYEKK